ncbi:MAG: hypothetical protein KJO53_01390 [Eudoraea sp.]|nr:hypothetical protein [Eudoraea sp.]MBT8300253.1 hypothetical protein [Maribacter sp.]
MKDLNKVQLMELSKKDTLFITGGGLGSGSSSLFRNSLYLGLEATHAVYDFAAGFIKRFIAHSNN